jgi:hypothetical protein
MRLDPERAGQSLQRRNADVPLAALDHADVCAVVAADVGQLLLRKPLRDAKPLDVGGDDLLESSSLTHFGHKCAWTR